MSCQKKSKIYMNLIDLKCYIKKKNSNKKEMVLFRYDNEVIFFCAW